MKRILILIFLLIVYTCSQPPPSYAESEPNAKASYSIGTILPLSRPLSAIGLAAPKGIELATKAINSKGGINNLPLKVYYEDSGGAIKACQ